VLDAFMPFGNSDVPGDGIFAVKGPVFSGFSMSLDFVIAICLDFEKMFFARSALEASLGGAGNSCEKDVKPGES